MMLSVQKIKLTLAISWAVLSCTQVQAQPVKPSYLTTDFRLWKVEPPQLGYQAEPRSQNIESSAQLIFAAPPPPPDIGEPGQRSEAGSRGCENINKQLPAVAQKRLTALVPVYSDSELVLGATIAEYPTFWFYIPYQPPIPGKFVLRDKDGKLVYQTDVTLPETPGVVSVSLPRAEAPLEIGKRYHWFLKIYCKAQQPPTFVEGWIQRNSLNPVLKSQLEKATPRDRFDLYATNGIWFDALSTAVELRRRNPQDTSWAALLRAVGLNNIAIEPIVQ